MAESRIHLKKNEEKAYQVGILALQGDFDLHRKAFEKLGCSVCLVKNVSDLNQIDRLVIPGGESTTINKLIDQYDLRQPLIDFGRAKPVWGTCAGLIMLSRDSGDERINPLKLVDIDSARNAYGRQIDSFSEVGDIQLDGKTDRFKMVFIRAPKITRLGDKVESLGKMKGDTVMARQGHLLVTSFHPELTDDLRIHEYFLKMEPPKR
ncbi:MAG: pyridoxal 5'-phosphate synthase glutaminase subunit PdxT [candidate division Zixibacteria bacterium]|nr:pyridoxal 5'-phosphate synthase glutaminase subunit PdxT [candidate division Zixibacteria bacterium]